MRLRPIGKRALVKPVEQEEKTASGIVLPQTAKEKPQTARVVAIDDSEDGKVNDGDLVVFARYSGAKITLDDEEYLILNSEDFLGVVGE